MEVLLQKIRAIHTTSEEIIARVENCSEVLSYSYNVNTNFSGGVEKLELEEEVVTVKGILFRFMNPFLFIYFQ